LNSMAFLLLSTSGSTEIRLATPAEVITRCTLNLPLTHMHLACHCAKHKLVVQKPPRA
jgi:hypothetical protein